MQLQTRGRLFCSRKQGEKPVCGDKSGVSSSAATDKEGVALQPHDPLGELSRRSRPVGNQKRTAWGTEVTVASNWDAQTRRFEGLKSRSRPVGKHTCTAWRVTSNGVTKTNRFKGRVQWGSENAPLGELSILSRPVRKQKKTDSKTDTTVTPTGEAKTYRVEGHVQRGSKNASLRGSRPVGNRKRTAWRPATRLATGKNHGWFAASDAVILCTRKDCQLTNRLST